MKLPFHLRSVVGMSFALLCSMGVAHAQIKVFACEPEWGALVKEIGADRVAVTVATAPSQDPHYLRAKPSLLAAVRGAALVVCSGASLEVGWLPLLLERAGDATVQHGASGNIAAAEFVEVLEKPTRLDRADGDVHPEGNPHVHLNPRNLLKVGEEVANRLQRIDPANAEQFAARWRRFSGGWSEAIARWEERAAPLRGMRVVVHHKAFSYLVHWLGLEVVGSIEPKPGVPPTTRYLETLLGTLRASPPVVILRTPYETADGSEWLSEKLKVRALVLPYTVGGDSQATTLEGLFEVTLQLLLDAREKAT